MALTAKTTQMASKAKTIGFATLFAATEPKAIQFSTGVLSGVTDTVVGTNLSNASTNETTFGKIGYVTGAVAAYTAVNAPATAAAITQVFSGSRDR